MSSIAWLLASNLPLGALDASLGWWRNRLLIPAALPPSTAGNHSCLGQSQAAQRRIRFG
jgi:hypothetical protein